MKALFLILTFFSALQAATYHPGFYMGSQVGYAWIQTPNRGHLGSCRNLASGKSGHFAYSAFTGVNFYNCFERIAIGLEGGYNDNGHSTLTFSATKNEYRITSRDFSLTSTFTYVCWPSIDLFLKLGAARVIEEIELRRLQSSTREIPCRLGHNSWGIVVNSGVGYSIQEWLNASVAYRGVLHEAQDNIRDRLIGERDVLGREHLFWKGVSSVHALYGSLSARF